jgi:hypothetical protein
MGNGKYAHNTTRVVVKTFLTVDVVWSRLESTVDKVPEEFAEEDTPDAGPKGVCKEKIVSPLIEQ